jgi:SnoaL-like polyketide cyclase
MTAEENKRLAREGIRIWITGDFDAADDIYAPDYVNHQHHDPDDPRDLHGVEAMKTFATGFREAFPDFHDSIDIQLAEGDWWPRASPLGEPAGARSWVWSRRTEHSHGRG